MNLGEFHTRVKSAIKRGSALDDIIPFWVGEAARLQEQNYTFSWMERTTSATIPANTNEIVLSPLIKSVDWIKPRWTGDAGTEWYGEPLVGVDSRDVLGIDNATPSGYWLEGSATGYKLLFDSKGGSNYDYKMKVNQYTEWPTDDAATPTLLLRGQMVLFCQTMILFANEYRDARMVEQYSSLVQGAMNSLLRSEEELKMNHQNDLKMNYTGLV